MIVDRLVDEARRLRSNMRVLSAAVVLTNVIFMLHAWGLSDDERAEINWCRHLITVASLIAIVLIRRDSRRLHEVESRIRALEETFPPRNS